jgi:hypothetical protein
VELATARMNRRQLLSLFVAAPLAALVDPERLLWVPGAKLISVGWASGVTSLKVGDTVTIRKPLRFHSQAFVLSYPALNVRSSDMPSGSKGMVRGDSVAAQPAACCPLP